MAVHTASTQSTGPTVAVGSAPAAAPPAQRSRTDPEVRTATGRTPGPTPRRLEGVKAAASVMGWMLWILLAFMTAAFLAFAPSML